MLDQTADSNLFKAEEMLERMEKARDIQFLLFIPRVTPFAIVGADAAGKIAFFNGRGPQFFGYTQEEIKGHPLGDLFIGESKPLVERAIERVLSGKESKLEGDAYSAVCVRKSGETFKAVIRFSAWMFQAERFFGMTIEDTTFEEKVVPL